MNGDEPCLPQHVSACVITLAAYQRTDRIRNRAERRLLFHARRIGDQARLDELDQEWDIDRVLETHTAGLAIGGFLLGAVSNRKWFVLPGLAGTVLLQYALEGWCPQLPVLRRLGFRTAEEIAAEHCALIEACKQPSKPK